MQLAGMGTGNWLESLNPFELSRVGAWIGKAISINELHGAQLSENISRQPDVAVASSANAPEQLVIGDARWLPRRGRRARRRIAAGDSLGLRIHGILIS